MDLRRVLFFAAAAATGAAVWIASPSTGRMAADALAGATKKHGHGAILPVTPAPRAAPETVALGKRLFEERRLSSDGTRSCADCHDVARGGADGRALAVGVHGRIGVMNTPTVFNADGNARQFWDGRAESLEAQVDGPLLSAMEMDSTWSRTLDFVRGDTDYLRAFRAQYADGVTEANVRDAIVTYERSLTTPGSRFDRWLGGDTTTLSSDEREGYALFKSYGCVSCHQGRNVGGNVFARLGIAADYFADRPAPVTTADLGRFNVTHRPEDRFRFRVPSLRLAVRTPPYFHDGSVPSLERAIVLMGKYQLGTEIPPADVTKIAMFLATIAPDPEQVL